MATMLARRIPAPGWAPTAPKATIVPASALRPAAAPTRPATAISPRRRPAPASLAGVAVDEDLAAVHAGARPRVGAAEPAAGGAAHDQPPAAASRRRPSRPRRPRRQLAVRHPRPDVRSRAALDRQPAAGHARAQARDATQVADDADVLLTRAGDVEQLADRRAAIAVPQREPLDLGPAQSRRAGRGESASATSGAAGASRRVSVSVTGRAPSGGSDARRGCRRSCRP